jgi:hypothetical protein
MVALMGVAGPPRSLSKGKSIMKLALTGIASVGILAVTVGVETTNATSNSDRTGASQRTAALCQQQTKRPTPKDVAG